MSDMLISERTKGARVKPGELPPVVFFSESAGLRASATWDLEAEVTLAAHVGHRRGPPLPGDALLHPALPRHLHRERAPCVHTNVSLGQLEAPLLLCKPRPPTGRSTASTWHVLVGELDVDDVISWFCGAVGDLAGAVLLVLSVDVHFAGSLDGQTQATISCIGVGVGIRNRLLNMVVRLVLLAMVAILNQEDSKC